MLEIFLKFAVFFVSFSEGQPSQRAIPNRPSASTDNCSCSLCRVKDGRSEDVKPLRESPGTSDITGVRHARTSSLLQHFEAKERQKIISWGWEEFLGNGSGVPWTIRLQGWEMVGMAVGVGKSKVFWKRVWDLYKYQDSGMWGEVYKGGWDGGKDKYGSGQGKVRDTWCKIS